MGKINSDPSTKVACDTEVPEEISIKKEAITKRTEVDSSKIIGGRPKEDNPQSTIYLLMPNGFGLNPGEGYYQNLMGLYNQANIGVTRNFSLLIGILPTFLFGQDFVPVWVIPKFSIPAEGLKLNVGGGLIAGTIMGKKGASFGMFFQTITIGNRDNNLSLGYGSNYDIIKVKISIHNVSGIIKMTPRWFIFTENYYLKLFDTDEAFLLTAGAKYISKRMGFNLGFLVPIGRALERKILPIAALTIPFGNRAK